MKLESISIISLLLFSCNIYASPCDLSYSQHLSRSSDLGSDIKKGVIACELDGATWSLGSQAITPPNGDWSHTPVYLNGQPQINSRTLSTLKDTFILYAEYTKLLDNGTYDFKIGTINSPAALHIRDSIDHLHEAFNIDDSRHSPLTSGSRVLIQAGYSTQYNFILNDNLKLTIPFAGTVGTSKTEINSGVLVHYQPDMSQAYNPELLDIKHKLVDSDIYGGVITRLTAYDISTNYVGTKAMSAYALLGYAKKINNLNILVEFEQNLSDIIKHQTSKAYPYLRLRASYNF